MTFCAHTKLEYADMSKYLKHSLALLTIVLVAFSMNSFAESAKKYGNLTKGIFLIATDGLEYTSLNKTVIYITQHDKSGTSGLIINRPTKLDINEAFPETHASDTTNETLYFGGPLHTKHMFMLTETDFSQGLHPVNQNVYFGTGKEMTVRLQSDNNRDKIRTFAGFMSWGPEQLESELDSGNWVMAPGNPTQLFTKDGDDLWKTLYRRWAGSWI